MQLKFAGVQYLEFYFLYLSFMQLRVWMKTQSKGTQQKNCHQKHFFFAMKGS